MQRKTYKLMLTQSMSAIDSKQLGNITNVLNTVPTSDYVITIEPTPYNTVCHFTTSITIRKRSLEEALPICNEITKLLESNGEIVKRFETILIWDEPEKHIYMDLAN